MGISFFDWLLPKKNKRSITVEVEDDLLQGLCNELIVRDMAFWVCANFVAKAISKCEFKTYQNNIEIKAKDYYLWNYSPNHNQSSSVFLQALVSRLFRDNEATVIAHDGNLLLADGYTRQENALIDDVFNQVSVRGFDFRKTFFQSEVLFFKLAEKNMRQVIAGMNSVYEKLLEYTVKAYQKSRGTKGVIEYDAVASNYKGYKERLAAIQSGEFKAFAAAESAAMTVYKGMKFTELSQKTYSNEGTRDIRHMVDDVFAFTANCFGIPPALITGQVEGTKDALDQFLTFCIDPITDMLQEEINRKRYGYAGFAKGNYLKIDTTTIKHIDLLDMASSADKLIASGVFSINDVRALMGENRIEEEWADRHFITKNYGGVEQAAQGLEGGEKK